MNDVADIDAKLSEPRELHSSSATDTIDKLRVAISQAISRAAYNAVNEQQQFSITAQAATTQAIMQIFSVEAAAIGKTASGIAAENSAATPGSALNEMAGGKLEGNEINVGSSDLQLLAAVPDEDFAKAFDALMSSFSRALNTIARDQLNIGMALVKQSLQTAIILKMVESPDKFDLYSKILDKVSDV